MAKVLVGLSGGVDSAVCAYLLKQQGHDVTCLFMRNWDSALNNDQLGNPTLNKPICPQEMDYNDAKKVAEALSLPLLRVDFIKEYWDYVFSSFLDDYKLGRTPNPDILCNKYIKFQSFFDYAMNHGFDYVATGHYAQVEHFDNYSIMKKGIDTNKDQSYFLCQVAQKALHKTLFPLGDIDKAKVREIAHELNLPIADKKDSTGICFIGERNFKEFLSNYLPSFDGDVIDIASKKVIHRHGGVLYYTVGQRKGLGIGGAGGPWVVVGKNVFKNELYVVNQKDDYWLYSDECHVSQLNWFNPMDFSKPIECMAKFRYRQQDHPVTITMMENGQLSITYPQKIASVAIGQEAVFYQNDVCLGGGCIDATFINNENLVDLLESKLQSI
ncbi:MAG: tRNA 2-thiouridine(34) synthase MnmA [Erysipelotrichaceae bacterium]